MQNSNQGAADASVDQVAQHSVAVQAGTEDEASTQVAFDPSYQGIGMPANKQANVRGNQAQGAATASQRPGPMLQLARLITPPHLKMSAREQQEQQGSLGLGRCQAMWLLQWNPFRSPMSSW